jgi:uncharacterized DUF497 family protein
MEFSVKGFQWDAAKSQSNLLKHGIDFEDAKEIFYGPIAVLDSNRNDERRWVAIGDLESQLIAVIFTVRNGEVRIISARRARKHEERAYRNKETG